MKKSEFFDQVYRLVSEIPMGFVMTYGQIGLILGSPFYGRQVGQAMSHAPTYLKLPCHRVVNSKGCLAPSAVFGGNSEQFKLLLSEGVIFKQNGCVDLKKSIWRRNLVNS